MRATVPPHPGTAPVSADRGGPPSKFQRILAYRALWLVALLTYGLDQLTKLWVESNIAYNPTHIHGGGYDIIVSRGFAYLIHIGNTGAAWSMFSGNGAWLGGLAVVTLTAIYFWRHSLGLRARFAQLCFGGLIGGTVGNLTDRLRVGHVIDFLDLHFGSYIYPTFNVADMGIVCGVAGYIIWSLKQPAPKD